MRLSVVIPTYNEINNITVLIKRLEAVFKQHKLDAEIIVVDDNSPDGTAQASIKLNKQYKNIITIIRKENRGFAKSLFRGLKEAKGKYVLCMDADLVHDPSEIPDMLELMNRYDIVIGSRYLKDSVIKRPMFRNIVSMVGQYIQRMVMGVKVLDTTNNFRLFKREVFKTLMKKLHTDGNVMLFEFVYLAARKGYKIKEIPINYLERTDGVSKLSATREGFYFIMRIIRLKLSR